MQIRSFAHSLKAIPFIALLILACQETDIGKKGEVKIDTVATVVNDFNLSLELIGKVHNGLTNAVFHPSNPSVLFYTLGYNVTEIFSYNIDTQNTKRVLDLRSEVSVRLFMDLEFHPDFESNGLAYISLVRFEGEELVSVLAEVRASAPYSEINTFEPESYREIISWEQFNNADHNIGKIEFGPQDGLLYISTGDGGCCADFNNQAQDLSELRGKILRIDVNTSDGEKNYSIPEGNPFVGQAGVRGEIFAYGFRNPYRFEFDSQGGMYIFDVGENSVEELNYLKQGSPAINFGWRIYEGTKCFEGDGLCNPVIENLNSPLVQIPHPQSSAIIGGIYYQGNGIPEIKNQVLFVSDFVKGKIWSANHNPENGKVEVFDLTNDLTDGLSVSEKMISVNTSPEGEPLILFFTGEIYKIVAN